MGGQSHKACLGRAPWPQVQLKYVVQLLQRGSQQAQCATARQDHISCRERGGQEGGRKERVFAFILRLCDPRIYPHQSILQILHCRINLCIFSLLKRPSTAPPLSKSTLPLQPAIWIALLLLCASNFSKVSFPFKKAWSTHTAGNRVNLVLSSLTF